jgi:hypothetical protein
MELTLEGHTMFHAEGTITVDLPPYMKLLDADALKEVAASYRREELIVAAGRHQESGDLVFMTGVGVLMEVDLTQFEFPATFDMFPTQRGNSIKIELVEYEGIEVDAAWAIRVGRELINLGTLADKKGARVSYVDQ